jgi:hypothetical protein
MSDKSKNGYEIRESLLGMAIGVLEAKINVTRENEYLKPEGMRKFIDPYTVDEVLATAETLYAFVSKK